MSVILNPLEALRKGVKNLSANQEDPHLFRCAKGVSDARQRARRGETPQDHLKWNVILNPRSLAQGVKISNPANKSIQ